MHREPLRTCIFFACKINIKNQNIVFISRFFCKNGYFPIFFRHFVLLFAQNDIYQTGDVAHVDFVVAVYVAGAFVAIRRVLS